MCRGVLVEECEKSMIATKYSFSSFYTYLLKCRFVFYEKKNNHSNFFPYCYNAFII